MIPNSSRLDVPNTPPCSTRTTNVPVVGLDPVHGTGVTDAQAADVEDLGRRAALAGQVVGQSDELVAHPSGNLPRNAPSRTSSRARSASSWSTNNGRSASRTSRRDASSASTALASTSAQAAMTPSASGCSDGVHRRATERVALSREAVEHVGQRCDALRGRIVTAIAGVGGQPDELDHDLAGVRVVDAREHGTTQRRLDARPQCRLGRAADRCAASSSELRRQVGFRVEVPARPPHRIPHGAQWRCPTPGPGTTRTSPGDRS